MSTVAAADLDARETPCSRKDVSAPRAGDRLTATRDHRGRVRVAVTGLGVKTPAGNTPGAMWSLLLAGQSAVRPITRFDPSTLPVRFASEVSDDGLEHYFGPKEARRLDRCARLGVSAALDAVADSGIPPTDPARMAIVVGTGLGGWATMEGAVLAFADSGPSRMNPFLVPMVMANATPALLAMRLGWCGPNYSVSSACASGAHAVGEGARLIRDGTADVVLCGGTESLITPTAISAFARMGALSTRNDKPPSASRPFDRDRDGFVMGEGAGFVVLESWQSALDRNAHIHGELVGYGRNVDAHHITAPSPGGAGAAACMQMALDDASLSPSAIGHINAHGTSTPLNDLHEAHAIAKVFGHDAPPVTSTKGAMGHLIGAAGSVEVVATVLAVGAGTVPPIANHHHPDESSELDFVCTVPRSVPAEAAALSNSFGFGGHNVSLILAPAL